VWVRAHLCVCVCVCVCVWEQWEVESKFLSYLLSYLQSYPCSLWKPTVPRDSCAKAMGYTDGFPGLSCSGPDCGHCSAMSNRNVDLVSTMGCKLGSTPRETSSDVLGLGKETNPTPATHVEGIGGPRTLPFSTKPIRLMILARNCMSPHGGLVPAQGGVWVRRTEECAKCHTSSRERVLERPQHQTTLLAYCHNIWQEIPVQCFLLLAHFQYPGWISFFVSFSSAH
jgi:hypothetical protein